MGWLKELATKAVKFVAPVMDPLTVAFVHPIQTIKAITGPTTMKQLEAEHFAQPLSKQITETVMSTIGYGTAIVGGAAIGGAAKAGTLAASAAKLIPTTLKGKVIGVIAAPVVIGAVIKEPGKTAEAIAKAPGALANVGGNVAGFIAEPSIEKAKAIVTENPVIVGAVAAVAVIAGAKAILPAIVTSKQIEATKEQTAAIEAVTKTMQPGVLPGETPGGLIPEKTMITDEGKPVTTQTSTITTGKRKRRKAKAAISPSIRQNVQVIVSNRSVGIENKRYLNERILA